MPGIGLGTWKSDPGVVGDAVKTAIELGYRHVDCAAFYGNEVEIGSALKELFEAGTVQREELFITGKLWNTEHAPEDVLPAVEKSIADLGVDYLDLYLIHWPVVIAKGGKGLTDITLLPLEEVPTIDTWRAMEECVDKGLIKDIGVSNFSLKKLKELVSQARIKPSVNQIEMHPYLQMNDLVKYCKEEGIHLTGYSPLGSNDRPEGLKREGSVPILKDETIGKIAEKNGATPAQVLLAWGLQRGTSVTPKSVNASRLKQNLEAANVELSTEDMDLIATLDKHERYIDGAFWCGEGSPYTLENIWDEGDTTSPGTDEL